MDLLLDYGDISVNKIEYDNKGNNYYDLSIELEDEFINKLIKRTLETPLGYIKKYINQDTIVSLDSNYGNPLYGKLSEPLSLSFIIEIQNDINNCLASIMDIPELIFNYVRVTDYTLDSVNIEINYTYKEDSTNYLLILPL